VRYHGVLAPHSKWRSAVVPRPPDSNARAARAACAAPSAAQPTPSGCNRKPAGVGAGGDVVDTRGSVPRLSLRGDGSTPRCHEAQPHPSYLEPATRRRASPPGRRARSRASSNATAHRVLRASSADRSHGARTERPRPRALRGPWCAHRWRAMPGAARRGGDWTRSPQEAGATPMRVNPADLRNFPGRPGGPDGDRVPSRTWRICIFLSSAGPFAPPTLPRRAGRRSARRRRAPR